MAGLCKTATLFIALGIRPVIVVRIYWEAISDRSDIIVAPHPKTRRFRYEFCNVTLKESVVRVDFPTIEAWIRRDTIARGDAP